MKISKLLIGMLIAAMVVPNLAIAESPTGCTGGGIQLNLYRDVITAHVGDTITYTIYASVGPFPPNCDIDDVTLSWVAPDGTPEVLIGPPGEDLLAGGTSTVFTRTYVVDAADLLPDDTILATAAADGIVLDGPPNSDTSDTDEISVLIVSEPDTDVGITADPIDGLCPLVTNLVVTEENTGLDPLTDVEVLVQSFDATNGLQTITTLTFPPDGDTGNGDNVLDPGEIWTWDTAPLVGIVVNELTTFYAIGSGIDPLGNEVSFPTYQNEKEQIDVDCTPPEPEIAVEKTVDCEQAIEGYPVTYTICISNTGPVPVEITSVIDTVLGDLTADFVAVCPVLDVGVECCLDFGPFVLPAEPDPFPNEVTVMAEDEIAQIAGPAIDDAEVDIVHPDLTVTKVCLTDPIEGDTAQFEITIVNTGDVDLSIVSDEAELAGPLALVVDQEIVVIVERPADGQDVSNEINVIATLADSDICVEEGYEILRSDNDTCTVTGDTFCSFTQGFWGNAGGTKCDPALTTTELLNALIPPSVIVGSGANTIEFVTPQDVLDGLPAGGKPKALNTGNVTYSALPNNMLQKGKVRNVLVGQVVALTLNLRMSAGCLPEGASGDLGALTLAAEFCTVPYDDPEACPEQVTIPEPLVGKTVAEILELANIALGGGELPEGITLGMLYEAASSINEGLDECRTIVSCPEGEICDNGCDDDFDGDVDCEDEDCDEDPACVD